jgi:hypothetical protein
MYCAAIQCLFKRQKGKAQLHEDTSRLIVGFNQPKPIPIAVFCSYPKKGLYYMASYLPLKTESPSQNTLNWSVRIWIFKHVLCV